MNLRSKLKITELDICGIVASIVFSNNFADTTVFFNKCNFDIMKFKPQSLSQMLKCHGQILKVVFLFCLFK